ncbi:DISARM system SNF2-like helicase DrmD [Photobacterium sp. ZSDE20]|uniref:DISARM system SNF2-like helicase DrmD n=1 Tax=Photobacterium pectinilyticum TaxID=2906793 RepID=A0ABT1N5I7_9GAMM|nr:DISARM system SNF2-like helicase DrmD [Photobacterium sp. ZSDE20]MCQ1059971.1 DISARM system SNF2-like helicase DrmD [Photobacterium sp. ZSDE20]MDD1826805.1 DISARM system SNF2-like helicase DrmD [Photobacterium sp. ZSDE20]
MDKNIMSETGVTPEQGQIVKLRHKVWAVTAVHKTKTQPKQAIHRVALECLSDNAIGESIQVIWEREVAPFVVESTSLPSIGAHDRPEIFDAFIRSLQWSASSLAVGDMLQAPFRGGVQMEEYQLVPVIRATEMPRVRLLLADDVGLGKTIEAGLVTQELIHSHRASSVLIVCPAHLKIKWVDEMAEKFGLEFKIIDRDSVLKMKKEYGPSINPWASFPRLVTSIDYLKTEHPRRLFDEYTRRRLEESPKNRPWDLLILDEAHNVAPSGKKQYVRDSDRTSLLRSIAELFEHKMFLTATPHNGYRESFTGLLEILDNLRFSRGTDLDKAQLSAVTIRRLKQEIVNPDGTLRFPKRVILPRNETIDPQLYLTLEGDEQNLFNLLNAYTESRLASVDKRSERPLQFILTLLKKRALSSPLALRESLITHTKNAGVRGELGIGESLFSSFEQKESEDWSDDEDKEDNLDAATSAASKLIAELTGDEKTMLQRMFEIVDRQVSHFSVQEDSKAAALIAWINRNLRNGDTWNGERVIIFTEYKHTLSYLERILEKYGFLGATRTITGGMNDGDRQKINDEFQAPNNETGVRILLATDAASEGADFQKHCRNLIHYEIPWNPIRLEQRNGRVDRHGQKADEVRIHHFVYKNQEDSEFLKHIVDKVETIRNDLGSVGALIADNVRKKALGQAVNLAAIDDDARRRLAREEMAIEVRENESVAQMVEALNRARSTLDISDSNQLDLLKQALSLEGCSEAIHELDNDEFTLTRVPTAWTECKAFISTDYLQKRLSFDRNKAREDDAVGIVHLDHPLMRRAISIFRAQMWGAQSSRSQLNRVAVTESSQITTPAIIAWGRLVLLGPEHNRLHEGLFRCQLSIQKDTIAKQEVTRPEDAKAYTGDIVDVQTLIAPYVDAITKQLSISAEAEAHSLIATLKERGEVARKHAQSLATERITAIRKAINDWQKRSESMQMEFVFDDEEQEQSEQDLLALERRFEQLKQERETEPKRQRDLYKVTDQRMYPVALEVILPKESN